MYNIHLPVSFAFKNIFPFISAWSYMIKRTVESYSQSTSHIRVFIVNLIALFSESDIEY